jgi:hypothetical protein
VGRARRRIARCLGCRGTAGGLVHAVRSIFANSNGRTCHKVDGWPLSVWAGHRCVGQVPKKFGVVGPAADRG